MDPTPPFVATVCGQPASFVQLSFLLGDGVKSFQVPLPTPTPEAFAAAMAQIEAEVAKVTV